MKKFLIACLILTGCTMEAEFDGTIEQGYAQCNSIYTGKPVFFYHSSTLRNPRAGIGAPGSVTLTDMDGNVRVITTETEKNFNCFKCTLADYQKYKREQ